MTRNCLTPARLCWFALAMLLLAGLGLTGLDRVFATATAGPGGDAPFTGLIDALDLVAGKQVSTFLLGFALLLVGAALLAVRASRRVGWAVLFVGAVQFTTTVIADLSKPPFGRLRPREVLPDGADVWFAGGNAFPSGHTAFYTGLALPLVALFPRAWPILAAPLAVGIGRVLLSDHYLSDVAVAFALAALVTAGFMRVFAGKMEGFRRRPE